MMLTPNRNTSLSKKLRTAIVLTSAVVLLVTTAVFVTYEMISFRQTMTEELVALAGVISYNTRAAIMFDNRKDVQEVLSGLRANPRVLVVQVFNEDGKLFGQYVAPNVTHSRLLDRKAATSTIEDTFFGAFVVSRPVLLDDSPVGMVLVEANMHLLKKRVGFFLAIVAFVLAIALSVALVLSSRLQGRISRPILQLVKTMQRVSQEKELFHPFGKNE